MSRNDEKFLNIFLHDYIVFMPMQNYNIYSIICNFDKAMAY